jgi:hypothetical protein
MVTGSGQLQAADQDVDEIVAVRGLEAAFSQCVDECDTVEVSIVGADEDAGDDADFQATPSGILYPMPYQVFSMGA